MVSPFLPSITLVDDLKLSAKRQTTTLMMYEGSELSSLLSRRCSSHRLHILPTYSFPPSYPTLENVSWRALYLKLKRKRLFFSPGNSNRRKRALRFLRRHNHSQTPLNEAIKFYPKESNQQNLISFPYR